MSEGSRPVDGLLATGQVEIRQDSLVRKLCRRRPCMREGSRVHGGPEGLVNGGSKILRSSLSKHIRSAWIIRIDLGDMS